MKFSASTYRLLLKTFAHLPIASLIDDEILAVHGGIGPELLQETSAATSAQPNEDGPKKNILEKISSIQLPKVTSKEEGLLWNLLWADPEENLVPDFKFNKVRNTSYIFSSNALEKFLENANIK